MTHLFKLVLHNFSFFAKNEKWFGEKFFAKNGPRKISRNFTKNCAKNDQIWPKVTSKMASFAKLKQDFDQNQSDSESN